MKIYIIGPSGSGKTTLAKKLSKEHKIPHYDIDHIRHNVGSQKGSYKPVPQADFLKKIKKITKNKDWILEGVNVISVALEKADKIIFIDTPLFIDLFRQWKRYFTDKNQRQLHGFKGNLGLSRFILRQYLGAFDPARMDDPDHNRVKKTKKLLEEYKDKVEVL